jgi:20S proteasome alpha/beta subunit
MTVLVSIKINDGVVMAADSASSFASGMIYHHAQKIVNLSKGLPIGAMVTGAGGIGNESIDTLLKDLRRRFTGSDADHPDWKLDPHRYTVEQVSVRVRQFLFEEKSKAIGVNVWTKVRLCGYSAGRPLAEVWEIQLMGPDCAAPRQIQAEHEFGPLWDGEYEALDRLIFGLGTKFNEASMKHGLTLAQAAETRNKLAPALYELLFLEAMPIQDAVDLARFLVQTTIGFVKFSVSRPKTVGGPIEIAAITKHEGFKWIERRHFFPPEHNASD